jgi:hypothetical protein
MSRKFLAHFTLSTLFAGMALAAYLHSSPSVLANCSPAGTPGDDNIICDNNPAPHSGDFDAGAGNDAINIPAGSTYGVPIGVLAGGQGNNLIVNDGTITNSVVGGSPGVASGNDTIINNGTVGSRILGDVFAGVANGNGNDYILNNGTVGSDVLHGIFGDSANGTAINAGNDTIINNGTVDGVLDAEFGDDLVIIRWGSTVTGQIRGGEGAETAGDTLQFSDVDEALEAAISLACPNPDAGCTITLNGFTYQISQFEFLGFVRQQLETQGFISLPAGPAGPRVICDDGRVKVFKLPNGDVEYYSGFNLVNPPNGFMVARVTPLDLSNGVRTFPTAAQTPNPLGWSVKITQTGNAISGQVFDENGNAVGQACRH